MKFYDFLILKNFLYSISVPFIWAIWFIYLDKSLDYTNFFWITSIFLWWFTWNFLNLISGLWSTEWFFMLIFFIFTRYSLVYLYVYLLKKIKRYKLYILSLIFWIYSFFYGIIFFNAIMWI